VAARDPALSALATVLHLSVAPASLGAGGRVRSRRYDMDENTGAPGATGEDTEGSDSRFGRAKQFVGEKYENASGKVRDGYNTASGAVRDGYNTVKEKVEDVDFGAVTDQVRTYVRSNPGKALLISVGVGFLIGLLLRRDDED
jgi:ElaB/YqjD/DUF883 family membrane-anchored ribosome-binding protein